jgi:hypothetical protein
VTGRFSGRQVRYLIKLETNQDRIRVEFETDRGEVLDIGVVQYETLVQGEWHPVARYDAAHGFFHLDILTPRGTMKYRVAVADLGQALTFAIVDLKENWRRYRSQTLGEA